MKLWALSACVILLVLPACRQKAAEPAPDNSASAAVADASKHAAAQRELLPVEPGVYGYTEVSEETDDESGMEIEVHSESDGRVETVLCEGSCNLVVPSHYRIEGDTIAFTYEEGSGNKLSFRVRQQGKDVIIEDVAGGWLTGPMKLKRLKSRDALARAAGLDKTNRQGTR